MIYFNSGNIEFQTKSTTTTAGSAASPVTTFLLNKNGRIAMGLGASSITPTAYLHLTNGSASANTAPLKFYLTGAAVMGTPEAGAIEAVVDTIYYTGNDVNRRKIALVTSGSPFLASGIHTPTATTGTNVTASTPGQTQYMRVGNTVTVSGYIEITCTTGGSSSQVDITIPVASGFTTSTQLSGTIIESVTGATAGIGILTSDDTNDRATILFTPRTTGSLSYRFTYSYQIL